MLPLSRRSFIFGASSSLMLASLPFAQSSYAQFSQKKIPELRGKHFELTIGYQQVNFTGKTRMATTINGSLPGPTLYWKEGEIITLKVTNHLAEQTSIHWHGIVVPTEMDGVPGLSFEGINPGETFEYRFQVKQSGTYWYHSHSGFQEQTGIYGAIIIEPHAPDPVHYDQQHIVMLSDWSDETPDHVFKKLKQSSSYYNHQNRTAVDLLRDIKKQGIANTWNDRSMWNQMRMSDRDISDVTGSTYTFLMNGATPSDNWTALFNKGERIRLRFINASAMTLFDVRIPGLKITIVTADGQPVEPITVDEFRMGVAETYDVIVQPESDMAYAIFAQTIDRSGFACGRLTANTALTAAHPMLDKISHLTMDDMGMMGVEERLDDPGIGLRDREVLGRKVLTYADLYNLYPTRDQREPSRELEMHLTGNMERYLWSIDGVAHHDAEPIRFRYGERLRITLINDTMMNHPMHLHGLWSELDTGDSKRIPRKHTMIVQPGSKVSYLVTADSKGRWAYHCHLMYHMMGMMREICVA